MTRHTLAVKTHSDHGDALNRSYQPVKAHRHTHTHKLYTYVSHHPLSLVMPPFLRTIDWQSASLPLSFSLSLSLSLSLCVCVCVRAYPPVPCTPGQSSSLYLWASLQEGTLSH